MSHTHSRFIQRPTPLSDTSQPLPYGNRAPRTKSHSCVPGGFSVPDPGKIGPHHRIQGEFSDSEPFKWTSCPTGSHLSQGWEIRFTQPEGMPHGRGRRGQTVIPP
ncbi:hypothetical protein HMPREF1549_01672 [Actinomyces johnsonii F0510]|uniref:Uncharacterized protein n=1 Tax=Actinomyces johnsonii F0510 TaxID=1227262 RepID=U1Q7M7_9ACTO|nr:hypothetical protein HMPREF1549_01672 [Actinomyces johnsonii F0510]